jgi:broad specificity phosphatase PhoE
LIYFLRHFKVNDSSKNWLNSSEFDNWVKDYDTFELEYSDVFLPKNIDKIYVSSQNRAIKSADFLDLDYEINDLLVEVPIKSFINTKFKLPKWLWLFVGRVAWFLNFKQNETKNETNKRVEDFTQNLDISSNILIISHGFFMMLLVKKLKKIGYNGNISSKMSNGKVYILKNK